MTEFSNQTGPHRFYALWVAALSAALFVSCSSGGNAVESSEAPQPGPGPGPGPGTQNGVTLSPGSNYEITGSTGGTFFPSERQYTLTNQRDSVLNWSVDTSATWLLVSGPASGTLTPGATAPIQIDVDVTAAASFAPDSYSGVISFMDADEATVLLTSNVDLTVLAAQPNASSTVGVNLSPVTYHSSNWPFVDIFKASRPWRLEVNGSSSSNPVSLTSDGWVAQLNANEEAVTYMFNWNGAIYPAGQYTVYYTGEGSLDFAGDATVLTSSPGEMTIFVQPNGGISMRQESTNPANPMRDIRIVMPGFENTYETEPFHPLFLQRLSQYSTLRFMDWAEVNNSEHSLWAERTRPETAQQTTDKGVAVEYMVQLANTLHADPWICIPHLADDDYVTQCATLIRDQLDPTLACHIEYSNEVWNWGFDQAIYCRDQGVLLWPLESPETARHRFYSQRSVQIFDIFESVFGSGNMSRVKRVLAGQRGSTSANTTALSWNDAYLKTDAYSIALYFGNGLVGNYPQATVATWTVDDMLDWCEANLALQLPAAANTMAVASSFGLPTISYEGGQHLVGFSNPVIRATYDAANRHPRMKTIYLSMLDGWTSAGGSLFTAFNSTMRWSETGRWGVLEYQDQPRIEAPKYDALMTFIER
ncbi:MAG: hypothetical protein ACI91B_004406 [Planctomycetota bacterium]|jgi:hypothetical protein